MHRGDLSEAIERSGNVGLTLSEEDALPVRRVRAYADVGRDREIRCGVFHGVDRAGDDVIALARQQRELVLPVRRGEEQETGETRGRRLARVAHELGDRQALEEWRVRPARAGL